MFNPKNKTNMSNTASAGNGTTLISAGTTVKGDISCQGDLRIDGTLIGNIQSIAKIIVGSGGVVEGDISCNQADISGKVSGNICAKELLQLRGDSIVTGNLYVGKLLIEPSATFNGECHMGANVIDIHNNEQKIAFP